MTGNWVAEDGDCTTAMRQPPAASGAGPVRVAEDTAALLPDGGRVDVRKCVRLSAFGLAWAVLNMTLIDCAFEANFKPPPYHIAWVFGASR